MEQKSLLITDCIEEISEVLNQKPSTIRAQLTRARYKLKEILKEDYDV